MSKNLLPAICCFLAIGLNLRAAHFVDATVSAGLQYTQMDPSALNDSGALVMSGAAVAGDYNGDGHVDLFVTRVKAPQKLFRNRGDGTFEDVAVQAGVADFDDYPNGAQWGDVDNDGDLDLYVITIAALGPSRYYLFINQGNGTFVEQAQVRGAAMEDGTAVGGWSATMGDFNRDGWLDIVASEWGFTLNHTRLLRNLGPAQPGFFVDATSAAGLGPTNIFGFAPKLVDLDGDGWQDLAISGDFGTSRLYWNNQDGTFTDGSVLAGVAHDQNGMGSTFGDYDGDGDLDWFVTAINNTLTYAPPLVYQPFIGNRLYRNDGRRIFSDQTDSAGVRHGYWGWGTDFLDFDNDTDLDLVMTNGFGMPSPLGPVPNDDYFTDPMRFWVNNGDGSFALRSDEVGVNDRGQGKGLITFDYDEDGDLDIFVVNNGLAGGLLLRNEGGNTEGGWLKVKVRGTTSNRDGLGARIRVYLSSKSRTPMIREVGVGGHYLGQSENTQHFGLGKGTGPVAKVEVFWPKSGTTQTFLRVARNSTLTVIE